MLRLIFSLITIMFVTGANAQNRLHPVTVTEFQIWGNKYFDKWIDGKADYQMFVEPSFSYPYALYVYNRDEDSIRLVAEEVRGEYPQKKENFKIDQYVLPVEKETAKKIGSLFKHAITTSMSIGKRWGFDGTKYFFFEKEKVATTWSPEGNASKLTNLLDEIHYAVKEKNADRIDSMMPRVDTLKKVFKALYPQDYFETGLSWDKPASYPAKVRATLSSCEGTFKFVKIMHSSNSKDDKANQEEIEKYKKFVEEVSREIFVNTDLLEGTYIEVDVDDSQPLSKSRPQNRNCTIYNVHNDDLEKDKLIEILKEME